MDLSVKNRDNMEYMINGIVQKLQVVNTSAIKAEDYDIDNYEELRDLYSLVNRKNQFSVSEIEAIVSELGALRNNV
ncbi:DUF1128 domain-containing protein [Pueribacillus theae]|uniref:UPF0435 protein DCC39_00870 n=1 Tax=Pueribacillus theae TaxID=2171751 RepID=A0A2U1K828_9BACI|nr:DUF1128 domain-containing protein [Pueribacillus theae]PWA13475.1 DUF1128 domain-containing protein [Pueribacillus theae]